MSNLKHKLIKYNNNSLFDNTTDPTTKVAFGLGEDVVVCPAKNSLISLRSLKANNYQCPFCLNELNSDLAIVGAAVINMGGKKAPVSNSDPQQRNYGRSPILWGGLAVVMLLCIGIAATGVLANLGGSDGTNGPDPVNTQRPTSTSIPSEPRVTNTPRNTARPEPTEIEIAQNSGYALISDEIYFASLRKSPGYLTKTDSTDVIAEVPSGSTVTLLDGPEKSDGLNWWYVEWNGNKGWIAEKTGSGKKIMIFNQ